MRIGEVLLVQDTVDVWELTHALRTSGSNQRLVSRLIGRAQLDSDDGAMALSEQLGYPAALERHLERRDPTCAELIPRELVQRWVALPLGHAHDGRLVVVARDPTPVLVAALEHAAKRPIVLAVAPGIHLEKLIRAVYGLADDVALALAPPTVEETRGIEITPDPPARRARTVSALFNDGTPVLRTRLRSAGIRVDLAVVDIGNAVTIAAAERIAVAYTTLRWRAALLLGITDGSAIGRRGHGSQLSAPHTVVLPLASPSIVQVAYDDAAATSTAPTGAIQQRLDHLLDDATAPAAAAIVVDGAVRGVLVVGDPLHGAARDAVADLGRLADALGAAHERFARRS